MLSRVDGVTSEADLVASSGLEPERVRAALQRLEALGALRTSAERPRPARTPSQAAAKPSGSFALRAAIEAPVGNAQAHHPAAALYDPGEIDEPVDLDLPRKRKILDLYYRLDTLTHYELLGLPSEADKKAVKAAYYEIVSVFHPDRYFGKNLGSFKPKLEKVFARLTLAHDVLTRAQSRGEYDAYLEKQQRNRELERVLVEDDVQEAELELARRHIEEQARLLERAETAAAPSSRPAPDPEARRRALARKLGRSPSSIRPPAESPEELRERVARDLKRRYEDRVQQARAQQVQRYLQAADTAIAEKNALSATNALRIAVLLAPEDTLLAERLAEVQQIASAELADNYLEQAQYEERTGRYAEAARSYQRAATGKDSPRLHDRVAFCVLEAHGDVRMAVDHAKRAVALAPQEATFRMNLGRAYLVAGMKQSAIGELERAAALAPADGTIREWLKRARRGDV